MTSSCNKARRAGTSIAWFLLLTAHVHAGEAPDAAVADDNRGAGVDHSEPADAQSDNIIDRIFSPLDKAVSDINRDLNDGNDGAAGESGD